jgi:hypothetical protein
MPDVLRGMWDLAGDVRAQTGVDDVFIASHGESAFALNALTGRKVVFMRRTHASPYVDVDERIADSAVILYGDDDAKRRELLSKYHVSYYYDDYYAAQNRQNCVSAWDSLSQNPDASYSCLAVTSEWASYLDKYNITYTRIVARFDPSRNDVSSFEQLAIKPLEQPRIALQPLIAGQTPQGNVAVVYRVN